MPTLLGRLFIPNRALSGELEAVLGRAFHQKQLFNDLLALIDHTYLLLEELVVLHLLEQKLVLSVTLVEFHCFYFRVGEAYHDLSRQHDIELVTDIIYTARTSKVSFETTKAPITLAGSVCLPSETTLTVVKDDLAWVKCLGHEPLFQTLTVLQVLDILEELDTLEDIGLILFAFALHACIH